MNTRYDNHSPFAHGHRSHPVSVFSAAVATSDKAFIDNLAMREDIQLSAFHKWEADGRPTGDGVNYWLEAERELSGTTEEKKTIGDDSRSHGTIENPSTAENHDSSGRGNSQDADRHSEMRHPQSLKR